MFSEKKGTTQSKIDSFLGPRVKTSKSVFVSQPLGFGSLSAHPKPAGSSLAATAAQGLAEEVARKREQKAQEKLENATSQSIKSNSTWRGLGNAAKGAPGT